MPLASFPTGCRALIVEPDPVQAMALDLLLEEFGCHCVVPIVSPTEIERCLKQSQPSFALVDVSLDKQLLPVAECLASKEVPFAVLTFGAPSEPLDRSGALRDRPRIDRPFDAPTLHAATSALYQQRVRTLIGNADRRIAEGRQRLADQLKRIERMAAAGYDTNAADASAREYGRVLQTRRSTRRVLARQLDSFTEDLLLPQRWGTKNPSGTDHGAELQEESRSRG
jgi:CheY-like chemotaxis protein